MTSERETLDRLTAVFPSHVLSYFASIESRTEIKTRINYAYDLQCFFKAYTSDLETLQGVTTADLDKYINSFKGEQSRARNVASLRSFFSYLKRMKYIGSDPSAELHAPKLHEKPIVRLDQKEAGSLINAAKYSKGLTDTEQRFAKHTKQRDTAIVTLFLTTGIRVSELVKLNVNDINLDDNSFIVLRKGGNVERLYFDEDVSKVLKSYIESAGIKDNDPLFSSLKKNRISVRQVEDRIKMFAKSVTSKRVTPHTLRRTNGTLLYEATGDIALVAANLGHKSVDTTRKHYADISDERKKAAAGMVKFST